MVKNPVPHSFSFLGCSAPAGEAALTRPAGRAAATARRRKALRGAVGGEGALPARGGISSEAADGAVERTRERRAAAAAKSAGEDSPFGMVSRMMRGGCALGVWIILLEYALVVCIL